MYSLKCNMAVSLLEAPISMFDVLRNDSTNTISSVSIQPRPALTSVKFLMVQFA